MTMKIMKKNNLGIITILFVTHSVISYAAPVKQAQTKQAQKKAPVTALKTTKTVIKKQAQSVPVQSVQTQGMIEVIGTEQNDKSARYLNYAKASYQQIKAGSSKDSNKYLQEALKNYQKVLSSDTSIYPYEGMIKLLFDCGHHDKVVELYEKRQQEFDSAFAGNTSIQLTLAQSLIMLNKDAQAEKIFTELTQKNPGDPSIAYHTAISYINSFIQDLNKNQDKDRVHNKKKYTRAQNFLDICVAKKALKSKHFLFYFLKSKLALSNNDKQSALGYIEKSLGLASNFDQGILLKAVLLEQLGKVNEAIKGYQEYLSLAGRDEAVEKQLVQMLFTQKRFGEAAQYQQEHKQEEQDQNQNSTNSGDIYFDRALHERKANKLDSALENINKSLEKNPDFIQARLLKIDILLASKKTAPVLECMESWISKNPDDHMNIHTLLLLKHAGIKREELIKTLETVAQKQPNVKIFAALADLHVEDKKYKTGLTWYKKILALTETQKNAPKNVTIDPTLRSKTLFYIGYLFYLAKNITKVENILKQAIASAPVYAPAYNLLAYYYAQTNTNLDTALNLVEKALATEQDCCFYLDTKGLILLKQGKREEAIKTLEIAHSLALDDVVILEHLALAKGEEEKTHEEPK